MRNKWAATIVAALVIATGVAAASTDTAVIENSGSTNSYGYTIQVSSDGKGSVTMQERGGKAASTPKAFTIPAATVTRFFSDLAAARKANAASVPCMKSVSFGTSEHIKWQGWTSPDLSCPPKGAEGDTLASDVAAIRQAAGIREFPMRNGGGPIVEPTSPQSQS
jgi:hypothetical protein